MFCRLQDRRPSKPFQRYHKVMEIYLSKRANNESGSNSEMFERNCLKEQIPKYGKQIQDK